MSQDQLTAEWIAGLLRRPWGDSGVLSIYVDVDPMLQSGTLPWAITIRRELDQIAADLKESGGRDRWQAFEQRIDEISQELEDLSAPGAGGRGRALFTSLERKAPIETVALQAPLPTGAILEQSPFVTPLVTVLDEGRPAAVVVLTQPAAEVWNVVMGSAERLVELQFDQWVSQARSLGVAQSDLPEATATDRQPRRRDEHRRRYLEWIGQLVTEWAGEHGWDRILLAGDVRLTAGVREGIKLGDDVDVFAIEAGIAGLTAPRLVEAVADELDASTRRREQQLVRQLRATVQADGPAVLGLSQTLALMAEGRVSHVVLDPESELSGYRTDDGWWRAEAPADADGDLVEEQIIERIIERALAEGIQVTPVEPPASTELSDVDGIGARLRW